MAIISFKSTPENYRKEYLGLKSNTVRKLDDPTDIRFEYLDQWDEKTLHNLIIEIRNNKTGECFERRVTDVTIFDGIYIISWGNK